MASRSAPSDAPQVAKHATALKLLEAAEELFAHHGYVGTTVRAVAKRAGVELGCIRHHFGAKQDLLRETYERAFEGLRRDRLESLERLLDTTEDPSIEEVFDAYFVPTVAFLMSPLGAQRGMLSLRGLLEHDAFWPVVREMTSYQHLFAELYVAVCGRSDDREAMQRFIFTAMAVYKALVPTNQNEDRIRPITRAEANRVRGFALDILSSDE